MADTVSNLSINFGANTAGLKMGVADVSQTLSKLGSQTTSTFAGFGSLFAPIAAGAVAAAGAVYGLVASVTEANDRLDTMAKQADTTGLSMETFQGFALAANLAGSNTDQLGSSLQKLQRNLVDARSGSGEVVDALQMLGLNAATVANMSTSDAFRAIADGIASIEDPALRTSAAVALFGRSGGDLVPLLSGGSQALQQSADIIDQYGLAISRMDAGKVEAANDAWSVFSAVISGIGDKLSVEIAPASLELAQSFTELAAAIDDKVIAGITHLIDISADAIEWMASLKLETVESTLKWIAFGAGLAAGLTYIPQIVGGIKSIVLAIKAMTTAQTLAQAFGGPAGWATLAASLAVAAGAAYAVDSAFSELTKDDKFAEFRKPIDAAADSAGRLVGNLTNPTMGKSLDTLGAKAEKLSTKMAALSMSPLNVGAVTRNSMAGFSAVIDGENAQKKLEAAVQKQVELQRTNNAQNEKIVDALRNGPKLNVITSI